MTKSKDSWLSVLLYFIIGILIFGMIRRTWKALLVSLIIGFLIVLIFPNILITDIVSSDHSLSPPLNDDDWQSIRSQQIFMMAGMCYGFYLAFLLISGRLLSTLLDDKFSRALREAEKVGENDPEWNARLQKYAKDSAELKKDMEEFCKHYPDSFLCKEGRSKSRFERAD